LFNHRFHGLTRIIFLAKASKNSSFSLFLAKARWLALWA